MPSGASTGDDIGGRRLAPRTVIPCPCCNPQDPGYREAEQFNFSSLVPPMLFMGSVSEFKRVPRFSARVLINNSDRVDLDQVAGGQRHYTEHHVRRLVLAE